MFSTDQIRLPAAGIALVVMALIAGCEKEPAPSAPQPAADQPPPAQADRPAADEPARPVDSETLPYAEVEQELVYGFFAAPADMIEPLPAVIVIHDWWGLDDGVRDAAARLAGEGFIVLAVDLYAGTTVDDVTEARRRMIRVLENPQAVRDNLRQAIDFVGVAGAPSIATLGWGLGGTWALNATLAFPQRIDAAVVFYGQVIDDERRLATLEVPLLGLYGARDRAIPVTGVRAFEETLERLEKPHVIEIYDDAGHRFADRGRDSFAPQAAAQAWQRVVAFLDEHLAATVDD
jgi:carboxymethylenebutenolidase